jgi:two-component system cell cycle response regulator
MDSRREPLDPGGPVGARDVAPDRDAMARSLAFALAGGAAIAALALALPDSVTTRDLGTIVPAAALAIALVVVAVAALVAGSGLPRLWSVQAALAGASALVGAAVHLGDASPTFVLYLPVVAYAVFFLSRPQAAIQIALVAVSYTLALFTKGAPDTRLAEWLVPLAAVVLAAILVRGVADRLRDVILRLADAARTDVLTGLLNRRGFEELIELELERARRSGRPLVLAVGDIDRFKQLNDGFGHRVGDLALQKLSRALFENARRIDRVARIGGEEFALIMPDSGEHDGYIAAERLRWAVHEAFEGDAAPITISFGIAAFPKHGATAESLFHAADQAMYAAKELGRDRTVIYNAEIAGALVQGSGGDTAQRDSYLATVLVLAEALDVREAGATRHSQTVGRYAEIIARELGLPAEATERIRLGGVLHDVGKVGIPDAVLRKPGPLTEREWHEVKRHPEIGARVLDGMSVDDIREWVLAHHERPDGDGYPRGLSGEQIPLEARILAVAEAYEAMTSERSYRPALSPEDARSELAASAGSQFDDEVVEALFRALDAELVESS